jgi:hypothetical protein
MAKQIKKYSKIVLIVGLMIALVTMYVATPIAEAGTLSNREARLSDSRLSQTSVSIDFLATKSAADNIACIKMDFCTGATLGDCSAPPGMDTTGATTTSSTNWNNLDPANWIIAATTTNSVTASSTSAENLGTAGSWVIGGLTNSSATSTYYLQIYTYTDSGCSTQSDTGVIAYAVLSGVTVTATVAETLNVTVNASTCDSFLTDGTDKVSATTSIAFGAVNTETFYNSCQRVDIGTNSSNGYAARIHKTQPLTFGGETISDEDCDGSCTTTTEQVWQTATNNGFGYCMKDRDLNAAQVADAGWETNPCGSASADQYFKVIANTSGEAATFMQSGSATTTNKSWVGYRLSVDTVQSPGDYTTTLIYTITPNY